METRCPECHSDDVIEWDDGWICRDCGHEFADPDQMKKSDEEDYDQ